MNRRRGIVASDMVPPKDTLPIGTHGFYLPDIRVWNCYANEIASGMEDDFILLGSIEDYILDGGDGTCKHCGSELIRNQLSRNNLYFLAGIIYCPEWNKLEHPKEYWIEVWPNANKQFTKEEIESADLETTTKKMFKLSNPVIKPCYIAQGMEFHGILSLIGKDLGLLSEVKLPEPVYRHG